LFLEKHRRRQTARSALSRWHAAWTRQFSATTLSRVVRGCLARKRAAYLGEKRAFLRLNVERVAWNLNKHLLSHVLQEWHKAWARDSSHRKLVASPLLKRFQARLLVRSVRAWRERARRQVLGRAAAKKAMKGLRGIAAELNGAMAMGGSRKRKKSKRPAPANGAVYSLEENFDWEKLNPPLVFYSEPLNLLAQFPEFKEHHERCVAKVLALKEQEDALVAEANEVRAAAVATAAIPGTSLKKKKKKKKKPVGSSSKVHPGAGEV